jgi:hypothetical protein
MTASSDRPVIETRGLSKRYRRVTALSVRHTGYSYQRPPSLFPQAPAMPSLPASEPMGPA